jgi:hypothetical protein
VTLLLGSRKGGLQSIVIGDTPDRGVRAADSGAGSRAGGSDGRLRGAERC